MGFFLVAGCVGLAVLGLVLAFWVIGIYNGLARGRVGAQGAWSNIDVQLKRRHDLIPNLVETVKGYAKHERETLEAVISARARAVSAGPIDAKIAAEGGLTAALGRLMAVAEAYPDLKANTNFLQLQGELSSTEDIISQSRAGYNGAAGNFNQSMVVFPSNIVAGIFGFTAMPFFEIENATERNAPQVKF
ncbi:MAG: LemA family protein [Planctomycetota bacterium]|jgi:LemA protein|nr:MAG: LemA family protein [Planctomycetota bacterium]RLS95692.1 MAG: LemA family protein [Planctomycetota bacterium]